jgi:hypothetical protein
MVIRRLSAGVLALGVFVSTLQARRAFPNWTAEPLGLSGVWERATLIAVGELHRVHPVGDVRAQHLSAWASPSIRRIYWCEGDFVPKRMIRGTEPLDTGKYLWGSIQSGCKLDRDAPAFPGEPLALVWFLRQEGPHLRPVVDAGGPLFFTLHNEWAPGTENPERYFGSLLLSPTAVGLTQEEYAQSFFKPAGLACWILGGTDCVQRIRSLAAEAKPALHDAACLYLKSQFGEGCRE